MKRWRGRAPKGKRRDKALETAIKMVVYPPVIVGAVLLGSIKKHKKRKR